MPLTIAKVIEIGAPSKIAQAIIQGIAIKMTALLARRPRAAETSEDELVNLDTLTAAS
jgi:hypothetical protein